MREIVRCLTDLHDEIIKEENIGDMRPILLETAANIITRAGFVMHDVKIGFVPNEVKN